MTVRPTYSVLDHCQLKPCCEGRPLNRPGGRCLQSFLSENIYIILHTRFIMFPDLYCRRQAGKLILTSYHIAKNLNFDQRIFIR